MILAEGLDYEYGKKLLKLASESPASEFILFTLCSGPKFGYRLEGCPKDLRNKFIANPEDFLIND